MLFGLFLRCSVKMVYFFNELLGLLYIFSLLLVILITLLCFSLHEIINLYYGRYSLAVVIR